MKRLRQTLVAWLVTAWMASSIASAAPAPEPVRRFEAAPGESIPDRRPEDVLTLADVLASIEAHDPRMRSVDLALQGAEGRIQAAQGNFDPRVRVRGVYEPIYGSAVFDARVEQPTAWWGTTVFGGYQSGVGRPARATVLDSILDVDDRIGSRDVFTRGGGLVAGVTVPLWRDGPIDRRRADLRQAKIDRERLQDLRTLRKFELGEAAAVAYWRWVASGLRLENEMRLLDLARQRSGAIDRRIELGALDPIAGLDNRRLILDREGRVIEAARELRRASLELSLFLRGPDGNPVIPDARLLPTQLPRMARPGAAIEAETDAAMARRPDRRATAAARSQGEIELRYAKNQRAPRIDASTWVAHRVGVPYAPGLERTSLLAALSIELPIPMRTARGQLQMTRAALAAIDAELRFLDDTIAVEVQDGASALEAAYQRASLAAQELEQTRELERAESRRFQLGAADLMLVNLRELATVDAANGEVDAVTDYFVAKARLEVALGIGVRPVVP